MGTEKRAAPGNGGDSVARPPLATPMPTEPPESTAPAAPAAPAPAAATPAVPTPAVPTPPAATPASPMNTDAAVDFVWWQFRKMDATSVHAKSRWMRQKRILLFPTLGVILLLPLGKALLPVFVSAQAALLIRVLTWLSGAAAALLAFINQIVGSEPSQPWIRARGAAETLRGEIFRFVGGAAPYDKKQDPQMLLERSQKILEPVSSLTTVNVSEREGKKGRPSCPADRARYLVERVDDQLAFFAQKAAESEHAALWVKRWTWFFGALVVVAGVSAPFVEGLDGWIVVITTLSATLATQLYLGRNEFQVALYQGAVSHLGFLKTTWLVAGDAGLTQQSRYVGLFEDEIARVNGAWLMEWTRRPDTKPEEP